MTYTCPNGHKIDCDSVRGPVCEDCRLIGTWHNGSTGEVYTWTGFDEHDRQCEALQDACDAAFDNQYFDSEGW